MKNIIVQCSIAAPNTSAHLRSYWRFNGNHVTHFTRCGLQYDRGDMLISSHWSTKKLQEMTERDWRIFREDFNIAYRGSNPPLPYRSWDECPLPKSLRKAVDKVCDVPTSFISHILCLSILHVLTDGWCNARQATKSLPQFRWQQFPLDFSSEMLLALLRLAVGRRARLYSPCSFT